MTEGERICWKDACNQHHHSNMAQTAANTAHARDRMELLLHLTGATCQCLGLGQGISQSFRYSQKANVDSAAFLAELCEKN